MRSIREILKLGATVIAAVLIGFGIPAGWLWIGSQVQGERGATSLDFSVAVGILFGIIITYVGVLYIAGWFLARSQPEVNDPRQRGTSREPWMRGMTDTRTVYKGQGPQMSDIERVFITTTLIVTAAAWVWFLFFAEGGGLPSQ